MDDDIAWVQTGYMSETELKARTIISRRGLLAALAAAGAATPVSSARADGPIRFGLTPVFLSNDIELLTKLRSYLSRRMGKDVQLVQRRTYEEITGFSVRASSRQHLDLRLSSGSICDQLSLVAVPLWNGHPLYSSYVIVPRGTGGE